MKHDETISLSEALAIKYFVCWLRSNDIVTFSECDRINERVRKRLPSFIEKSLREGGGHEER